MAPCTPPHPKDSLVSTAGSAFGRSAEAVGGVAKELHFADLMTHPQEPRSMNSGLSFLYS